MDNLIEFYSGIDTFFEFIVIVFLHCVVLYMIYKIILIPKSIISFFQNLFFNRRNKSKSVINNSSFSEWSRKNTTNNIRKEKESHFYPEFKKRINPKKNWNKKELIFFKKVDKDIIKIKEKNITQIGVEWIDDPGVDNFENVFDKSKPSLIRHSIDNNISISSWFYDNDQKCSKEHILWKLNNEISEKRKRLKESKDKIHWSTNPTKKIKIINNFTFIENEGIGYCFFVLFSGKIKTPDNEINYLNGEEVKTNIKSDIKENIRLINGIKERLVIRRSKEIYLDNDNNRFFGITYFLEKEISEESDEWYLDDSSTRPELLIFIYNDKNKVLFTKSLNDKSIDLESYYNFEMVNYEEVFVDDEINKMLISDKIKFKKDFKELIVNLISFDVFDKNQ